MEEFLARELLSEKNNSPSRASEKECEFIEGAAYRAAIDLSEWPKDVRSSASSQSSRRSCAEPKEALSIFFFYSR